MKRIITVALVLPLLGVPYPAGADLDEDLLIALSVRCGYSDYKTFQIETTSLERTGDNVGKEAATKTFRRGEKSNEVTFIVKPGEVAECVFPSGNRVRAKVGEGSTRYGMCGADPEVFFSVWVNKRKIASRVWFAGHCREENGNPDVGFEISGQTRSIQKCHTVRPSQPGTDNTGSELKREKPLSVCVDFPEISRFPRDELEYPKPGKKLPAVGEIEILYGSHEICKAVVKELKADFSTFGNYPDQEVIKLLRPTWSDASVDLPKEFAGSSESIFDFDNDGKLDRVFRRIYETNYMDGSGLLVQPGSSASALSVSDTPRDKNSRFFPCQMSSTRYEIGDCPGFSQKGDDAGFWMKGRPNKNSIYFLARYSTIAPFTFQGDNFIGVGNKVENTKNFVAVLKPMPYRKFKQMCLFRRVPENF
mgnify:CR=1 FL=1